MISRDHCRIGSLEKYLVQSMTERFDHCRIGSLEMSQNPFNQFRSDHCRIGSLEIQVADGENPDFDHCRIGSLEISSPAMMMQIARSLPHRQLRNAVVEHDCE